MTINIDHLQPKIQTYNSIFAINVLQLFYNFLSTIGAPVIYNDYLKVHIPAKSKILMNLQTYHQLKTTGQNRIEKLKEIEEDHRRCLKTR